MMQVKEFLLVTALLAVGGALEQSDVEQDKTCDSAENAGDISGRNLLQSHMESVTIAVNAERSVKGSQSNPTELALRQAPNAGESEVMVVNSVSCGELLFAPEGSCPEDCPYYAEEPDQVCRFRCVKESDCGKLIPANNIADKEGMFCRPCKVPGCDECIPGEDKCAKCAKGYIHAKDGHCYSAMWVAWIVIFSLVGLVGIFLVSWYVTLRNKPIVNAEGLKEGLNYRSRLKLRMPRNFIPPGVQPTDIPEGGRSVWPMSTSLLDVDVAGPGLLLHFNYHVVLIAWACITVSFWIVFAYSTEIELLVLGLYSANSPQEMCTITIQGRKAQGEMMWAKVIFLVIMYLGSFIGFLVYGVYTEWLYQKIDADKTSMRDYAVFCTGLPRVPGTQKIEEEFAKALTEGTGQKVVGVSVAWDYREHAEKVEDALDAEIDDLAEEQTPEEGRPPLSLIRQVGIRKDTFHNDAFARTPSGNLAAVEDEGSEPLGNRRKGVFGFVDKQVFGEVFGSPAFKEEAPGQKEDDKAEIKELVKNLTSTDSAYAVFETEAARDAAVDAVEKMGGLSFQGALVEIEAVPNEPGTVCWDIFSIEASKVPFRMFIGVVTILIAVIVWCLAFYLPYAYYTASFSAKHHEEPGFLSGLTFTMLVVAGNLAMYALCNEIAYRVGFRYKDDAEGFYIVLYTFACFLNLLVDLLMEMFLGYQAMVAAGVHIADGRLLGELTSYQEIFESYPMQRALGRRIFAYCFPSTFFIPFIFEPIGTVYVPYHLMKLFVSRHKGVRGRDAEKSLQFFAPMDLGRYGDLSLNVVLTSLIFFFPPGETLKLFLALIISHFYIYSMDKYRVLRSVPAFCFAGNSAERTAQCILALPCGFILAAAIFKGNCSEIMPYCMHEQNLALACFSGFILHITAHILILKFIVPKYGVVNKEDSEEKAYPETASDEPCTWFSANPIHCLRSKYVYEHSPPCCYFIRGQEHLMKANKDIGCYFEDPEKDGVEEDYSY